MNAQLVLENVGVRLPSRVLFEDVNWTLYEGMRVALAGRNGCGKSTLMRILAGFGDSTSGKRNVVGGRKLRVGFLDQSLLDRAVIEAEGQSKRSPAEFLISRMHDDDPEADPTAVEWEVRKILSGLGFSKQWMDNPMGELSGGWLLRIFIGDALLKKPEVLLLDEPTNHLDISSIQWLEEFLQKEYEGSLVLITHDVSLQRRVTDALAVLHGGRFYFRTHQNNYLTFRESLGEEKRLLEKSIESTKKKIEENMEFVYKFRAKAQTAARAQSKLKAAETLTEELNQLKDRLARVEGNAYNLRFQFRHAGTGAKFPVSLKSVSLRYHEESPWILRNVSLDIARGQRIAIIGDNGAGKTTLLNVIAERLKPVEGEHMRGYAVEMGYFGQHQLDELSLDDTVVDNLRARAAGVSLEELRGWLGAFGFTGNDEIQKKVKVLSGGERARLAMLRILLTRINFLLLDEPTNHLDIETKELLKNSIREFEGTTVIVSHDREFIGDIAERIIYLTNDHQLIDHLGNLASFFEKYPQYVRHIEGGGKLKPSQAQVTEVAPKKAAPAISFEERKKYKNQARSLEKKISTAESEIEKLTAEKDSLYAQLPSAPHVQGRIDAIEATLLTKMSEWEKWASELDQIRTIVPDLA